MATESESLERLTENLRSLIPELLEANGLLSGSGKDQSISFELTGPRSELVSVASRCPAHSLVS